MEPNLLLVAEGSEIITSLTVDKIDEKRLGGRLMYNILCSNKTGFVTLVYFNAFKDFITKNFSIDRKIVVAGKIERYKDKAQIVHPGYIVANINDIPVCEPTYPLTYGITNKMVNKLIKNISLGLPELEEWSDLNYLKKNGLPSFSAAIRKLHTPESAEDLGLFSKHRLRLAYDEILANQLALAISRRSLNKQKGIKIETDNLYIKQLLKNVPFKLTDGQKVILREIVNDLKSGNRMFRMLQGDVGSGKTIVAIAAAMEAVQAGYQAAIMLPTEILAKQQFDILETILKNKFFVENDVGGCLLIGALKQKEKDKLHKEIAEGKHRIIVGTHALLQEDTKFKNLGFIVIDEQHRFGVKQRLALSQKGENIHVLLMSATPIPRTLAMTVYGDLEVSSLTEKPAGRVRIDTRVVQLERIDEVVDGIKRAIKNDDRVYWVCPLIEEKPVDEKEPNENASAEKRYKELKKLFGDKVALVHGKLKTAEKDTAIERFRKGEVKILVATTVIEVGVNVPEATIIVIEQAEKFGLAQLHQLRGRVGRSDKKSSCILLYSNKTGENGKRRLNILRETDDGFKIAEEDLAMRGSGDIVGTKQSGFPDFNFAVLPEHKELLFAARDDVKLILNKDQELRSVRGQNLRILLYLYEYDKQIKVLGV